MFRIKFVCLTLLCSCLFGGDTPARKAEAAVNDAAFHPRLLEIAAEYLRYGRVDDEMRWAPWMCKMPNPSLARFSAGDEGAPHADKIYFLFAKQRDKYLALKSDVGQAIVKESWKPKEVPASTVQRVIEQKAPMHSPIKEHEIGAVDRSLPYVRKGEKLFHAEEKSGLFIMLKLEPATPGTDDGWIYGTLTSDGKHVTSAGKVASCMNCHKEARADRLFGMPQAAKPK